MFLLYLLYLILFNVSTILMCNWRKTSVFNVMFRMGDKVFWFMTVSSLLCQQQNMRLKQTTSGTSSTNSIKTDSSKTDTGSSQSSLNSPEMVSPLSRQKRTPWVMDMSRAAHWKQKECVGLVPWSVAVQWHRVLIVVLSEVMWLGTVLRRSVSRVLRVGESVQRLGCWRLDAELGIRSSLSYRPTGQ